MKKKLSFRKHAKLKGLSAIGNHHPYVDIKLNGKIIGSIVPPSWHSEDWRIQLAVIEENGHNYGWTNIHLEKRFQSEEEAREFMITNLDKLLNKYSFHERDK